MIRPVRIMAIGVALAAAFLAACNGDDSGPDETPAGSTPTPAIVSEVTREHAGIRLTLSVDGEKFEPGETVTVRAKATNISGGPLTLGVQTPGQPIFTLAVTSQLAGVTLLNAGATDPAPGDVLEPDGTLDIEATWDQQLPIPQTPVTAPPGQYSATAELQLAGVDFGANFPVSAAVTFELEGSEPVVLPQDAMKAALLSEPIKAWFTGRNPAPVCAYPARGLFYLGSPASGVVNESLQVLYNANNLNGYAICSILSSEEGWWLLFYAREGSEPNRIMVWVDMQDGTFIRAEEGGPTPAPFTPGPTLTPILFTPVPQ